MTKQEVIKSPKALWFGLLVVGVFSQGVIAQTPVSNTSSKESIYEASHQGVVDVNVVVFNAPCDLNFDKNLMLTGCGAGSEYAETKVLNTIADTPAKLKFYDALNRETMMSTPISLSNGNNFVHMPLLTKNENTLRLEVSYE